MNSLPDDQAQFFQRLRLCTDRSGWLIGGKYHGLSAALFKMQISVTHETIRQWFLGNTLPDQSIMPALASLIRVNPMWLSKGVGDPLLNVPPKPKLSGPEYSRIPVITPELCYEWRNYLPVPVNLPRFTVYRLCHPRSFAYIVRQRKPAGCMRPQRHVIVSPLEARSGETDNETLIVVCDQRKFHVGYLERLGATQFLRSPDQSKTPLRLSFSHQIAGFIDPITIPIQSNMPEQGIIQNT